MKVKSVVLVLVALLLFGILAVPASALTSKEREELELLLFTDEFATYVARADAANEAASGTYTSSSLAAMNAVYDEYLNLVISLEDETSDYTDLYDRAAVLTESFPSALAGLQESNMKKLREETELASSLTLDKYTTNTRSEYENKLSAAKVLIDTGSTDENALLSAYNNLYEARLGLVEKADTTELVAAIASPEAIDLNDYTQETAEQFSKVIEEAEKAVAGGNLIADEAENLIYAIQSAGDKLVKRANTSELQKLIALVKESGLTDSSLLEALTEAEALCNDANASQEAVNACSERLSSLYVAAVEAAEAASVEPEVSEQTVSTEIALPVVITDDTTPTPKATRSPGSEKKTPKPSVKSTATPIVTATPVPTAVPIEEDEPNPFEYWCEECVVIVVCLFALFAVEKILKKNTVSGDTEEIR